jgi:predicted ATPase/class 3 adenylate cyclase
LLTDIEHSTLLWDRDEAAMAECLPRHDQIVSDGAARRNGRLIKARGEGDSHFIVFDRALDAALAAAEIQRDLQDEPWTTIVPLKVRMSVHLGELDERDGDYYGQEVNRAARIRGIGHGGQILVSSVVRELIHHRLPSHCWLSDLGDHRLRDLLRSEHVFQLCSEGTSQEFPKLNSLDLAHTNLPTQLTSFVGREDDIESVRTLLVENRLITLLGPGGCGKTRLATQVAAEGSDEFPDGVWFVDLASISEGEAIERTVASDLQVPLTPATDLITSILGFLAGKRLLVVIDNCEHLGEGPAKFLNAVIKALPDARFIATSRKALGLSSEHCYVVRPLTKPDAGAATRKKVLNSESVQLMIDRAWAKAPSFQISDGNAKSVAALCTALEGMPLAIELAASRLRVLSPEQLFERLSKRLDLLKGASTDKDARHQTLRATVEWSFNLLKPEERNLLLRMGLLPAGCSLEIAEIAAADLFEDKIDVLDVLESLVNNSLVQVEGGEEPRYRMLETIRQYCAEQITEEESFGVYKRLLPWAVDFARTTKPRLNESEHKKVLKQIETEYENLRACLAWSYEHPDGENGLLSLASELDRYWFRTGLLSEGADWLEKSLVAATGDATKRAVALRSAGVFAWKSRDYARAEKMLAESVESFRLLGDKNLLSGAVCNLALALNEAGQVGPAESAFKEALDLAKSTDDRALAALVLQNLGFLERGRNNFDEAMKYFKEALPILELNDPGGYTLAVMLSNVAALHRIGGNHREAASSLRRSIEIARDLKNPELVGDHIFNLAQVAFAEGHFEMSARLLGCGRSAWKAGTHKLSKQTAEEEQALFADLRERLTPGELSAALGAGVGMPLGEMAEYALVGSDLLADRIT